MYCIYEVFPCKLTNSMYKHLLTFDTMEDAKKVMYLLYETNYNWTCYVILHTPYNWRIK